MGIPTPEAGTSGWGLVSMLLILAVCAGSVTCQSTARTTTTSFVSASTSNNEHDVDDTADHNLTVSTANPFADQVFVWTHHQENYPTAGRRLDDHVFLSILGKRTNTQCALECLRHGQCQSFNYAPSTGLCQLNDASHAQFPGLLAIDYEQEYHTRTAFSISKEALGPCFDDPCSGHGRCLETQSLLGDMIALCLCEEGWAGTACNLRDSAPQWAPWQDWGACSVSCHRGWRVRQRACEDLDSGSALSPVECYGADQEYGVCQERECPRWQEWGSWGECSTDTSCGQGAKVRTRTCSNGGVIGVDRYCLGLSNETTPCDGPPCFGPLRLTGSSISGEGVVELYDATHRQWTQVCSGLMTTHLGDTVCRQIGWPGLHSVVDGRHYAHQAVKFSLTSVQCTGHEMSLTSCRHNVLTAEGGFCPEGGVVPAAVQCNVNGVWSMWSGWSECDVTCENGTRTRTRTCSHPPAMHDGKPCEGETEQYKPCTLPWCPTNWLEWGQWSHCDVWCGHGVVSRQRTCMLGQGQCEGEDIEERDCFAGSCLVDGMWTPWTEWTVCSLTCGGGTQGRTRTCEGTQYGGRHCEGKATEDRMCNELACPIDGYWQPWAEWSECSLSCGNGTTVRNRTCVQPKHAGQTCNGSAVEEADCNTHHCPVDGEWMTWQAWGQCSVTCGGGQQQRMRTCRQPLHGGDDCEGSGEDQRDCNTHNCPIDGVWNTWSEWADCSVSCAWGIQWRNRTCDGPYYGGSDCTGNSTDSQECHPRSCPVDGHWMDWESWQSCSTSCGGGMRNRIRQCYRGQHGGKDCDGSGSDDSTCNEHPCPVDGQWLDWSGWGECSTTCGSGSQWRSRSCDGPYYGGANCTGPSDDDQVCNTDPCPIDGVWEAWALWTDCTLSCGGGTRFRDRNCTGPFYGGAPCPGSHGHLEDCNVELCPVDGSWKPWSQWSACSLSCGGGLRERDRACKEALHGGDNCTGPSYQNETCNIHNCPVDGVWESWSLWGPCTVSCGGGDQGRNRTCTGPFYGGQPCPGDWTDTQTCNDQHCPVDGYLTDWSTWASCDVTCGGGSRQRNRTCVGPFYGGSPCNDSLVDTSTCNNHHCPIDGVFLPWAAWAECSVSCGGGAKYRNRTCDGPYHLGADCVGPWGEEADCKTQPCPVDGAWLPWADWEACSVTCDGGTQSRDRQCNGTQHGGKLCEGDRNQTRDCNTHPCPEDGYFSDWSSWSTCTLTCGSGSQERSRQCIGPFHDGKPCVGDLNQTQSCNDHHCPIDGYYQEWAAWETCSVTCGGGEHHRFRQCEPPKYQGKDCVGASNETQNCNTQNCPVDGVYGDWADWSPCTTTCGGGSQWKNRTCTPPQYGGQDCQGPDNVTQDCNTNPCPIDGVWQLWGVWSSCNTTCGGGMRTRSRDCTPPQHQGKDCEGSKFDYLSCSENPCPIPGDWFPWTEWTGCTVTCGGGTRHRSRTCDEDSYGDLTAPCEGDPEEDQDCHTFDCRPLARTCTEWGERGLTADTHADIDPDGPGDLTFDPEVVFCDMTSYDGVGVTVIGHDQEQRVQVQGWEGAREYEVELTYNITFEQVTSVIDQSEYCEQYISWECFAALIHNYNDNNKVTTGWLNRTRGIADYFGGASPGSHSCACGMNSTCASPEEVCNCDSNDQTWRQDDGYLTYKDDLPVYAFVAGDTGEWMKEEGYHTIGPLRCYGRPNTSG